MIKINKKIYAFIPAKNNSKRLKKKNFLKLNKKKNYQRVIELCKKSRLFDNIILSSNDKECENFSKKNNILFDKRPISLIKKKSTVANVTNHLIKKFNLNDTDIFCVIYPTAILLSLKTLKKSFNIFRKSRHNILMGVSQYNYSPLKALNYDNFSKNYYALFKNRVMDQTDKNYYFSNGTFYWGKVLTFKKEKSFYSKRLGIYEVPQNEVADIDTIIDWKLLKRKYEISKNR